MAWRQVAVYVGAQLGGAVVAGLALFVLVQGIDGYDVSESGLAQNSFGDERHRLRVVGGIPGRDRSLTAIFVYVILAVTDARNEHPALAPAAIGLTLTMIHFASISLTGTSVNPARSIGVGALRRKRRDHPALAVHRRRRWSALRSRASPTR